MLLRPYFTSQSTVVLNQREKMILVIQKTESRRASVFWRWCFFSMVVSQGPPMAPRRLYKSPKLFDTTRPTPLTPAMASASAQITGEEFKTFHSIDRELYARLVQNLSRNPGQSMQVLALWLWLEQTGHGSNLVTNLLALPDLMINAVADETFACLNRCYDNNLMPLPSSSDANLIPLLRTFTKGAVSLQFFQKNRTAVIAGVTKMLDEVCTRAFDDIVQQTFHINSGRNAETFQRVLFPLVMDPEAPAPPPSPVYYSGMGSVVDMGSGHGTALLALDGEVLKQKLSPLLDVSAAEVRPVPPDQRTIFLTFSKGYPILEKEIKDFFTRKYGNFIEAIHMQGVNEAGEQPLYARLVARSPSSLELVLEGNSRAKFSINGKHVWARKYFRKSCGSPQKSSSPPSSRPTSPSENQELPCNGFSTV